MVSRFLHAARSDMQPIDWAQCIAMLPAIFRREFAADLETPVGVFLKLREGHHSFLLESVEGGEARGRYSIIGTRPRKVIRTGPGLDSHGDPLEALEKELEGVVPLNIAAGPSAALPGFSGGAVGFVTYDCIRYFEPRTDATISKQKDPLKMPEAAFMLVDDVVVFDHARHTLKIVSHCPVPTPDDAKAAASSVEEELKRAYNAAKRRIAAIARKIEAGKPSEGSTAAKSTHAPSDVMSRDAWESTSNAGKKGYEGFVRSLKKHIVAGDIIQAVPSHRLRRPMPSGLSAFDLYRHLRIVNPSPYMFYLDCGAGLSIVGASPEMLCKVEDGVIQTHPIAGTRRRGLTPQDD